MDRRWRLARALGAAAVLIGMFSCAREVPPSGGPVDKTPPAVVWTSPRLFAVDVPLDAELRVAFSERMDRDRTSDGVEVRPQVDWGRQVWQRDTLLMAPRGGWAPETTYTVLLRRRMPDRRGNTPEESSFLVFSTGPEVARGTVSGELAAVEVTPGEVLMLAFTLWNPDTTAIEPRDAVSVSEPDESGRFFLPGLDMGRGYEIGAFFDVNENRAFDPERDLYCRALEPVFPDSGGGPRDVRVTLVWNDTWGSIQGVVDDSTCAGLLEERGRLAGLADSLAARRDSLLSVRSDLLARADSLLGEAVAPIDPGESTPESLRAAAAELRGEAEGMEVPDSTDIAAAVFLPPSALTDSLYCARPIVATFRSEAEVAEGDTAARFEDRPFGDSGPIAIMNVPPGPYGGVVWRDLDGDGRFDPLTEPGTTERLRFWVPPGQAGWADTLRIGRPLGYEPTEE